VHQPLWVEGPPPVVDPQVAARRGWPLSTPGKLTQLRMQLRDEVLAAGDLGTAHEEDVDWLLLAFEELVSNGLRHGRAPVEVTVLTAADGWLIDVTDAAIEQPPTPATGRDPANGGLGLHLVARLSATHGWSVEASRKHVWAYIRRDPSHARVAPQTPGAASRSRTPAAARRDDSDAFFSPPRPRSGHTAAH
jgi:anti-sigma regulatory factor (Ser/Thr protein kinase)